MPALPILFWAALGVGALTAAAALYGRYRALPAFLTGPEICRLEENGCVALFRTRTAALLGVPNALLGLLCYAVLAVGSLRGWPAAWLLAAATPALAASAILAFVLVRDRLECRICWTGHAANLTLWMVLAVESLRAGA